MCPAGSCLDEPSGRTKGFFFCSGLLTCNFIIEYIPPDDNSKQKDLAFVGYTFKRFESLTKRNAL